MKLKRIYFATFLSIHQVSLRPWHFHNSTKDAETVKKVVNDVIMASVIIVKCYSVSWLILIRIMINQKCCWN